MSDNYNAWPGWHMAIVGDIDQQFVHCLFGDPTMEDVDDLLQINSQVTIDEDLDIDVL
jgi:hypothetical protein